jgi:glycosyltransferase involved in cell wall biosynthesis
MKKISIITGTFNEEENIEEWVNRITSVIKEIPNYSFDIHIIDNDLFLNVS